MLRNNDVTNDHTDICVNVDQYSVPGETAPIPEDVVIEGNRIHDCGQLPATNYDHAIYISDAVGAQVLNNWIYDNADRGIQLYPNATNSLISGNVLVGNDDAVLAAYDTEDPGAGVPSENLVTGNVIADSRSFNALTSPSTILADNDLTNNCVWTDASDPYWTGDPLHSGIRDGDSWWSIGNLVRGPAFVGEAQGDFTLKPGSACADFLD